MAINKGKQFEDRFRLDWKRCFPGTLIFRIPDQISGFKQTSQNPCDYFAFKSGKLFMVECKSHEGASISFSAIPQYVRLLQYKDLENVYPGSLIWFRD